MVVYAAEVPVGASIVKTSSEEPFLCLVVPLDPQKLIELILKVFPHSLPKTPDTSYLRRQQPSQDHHRRHPDHGFDPATGRC